MTKIILNGCNGQMGRVISNLCAEEEDIAVVAGVDLVAERHDDYPVYAAIADCREEADVIVDFSNPACTDALLLYSVTRGIPVVLCTTGLSKEQQEAVRVSSEQVAVLQSANMSLGINTLLELLKPAARALAGAGFDIEIVEKHHNKKLDAPSGTALALADAVNEAVGETYRYTTDRSGERRKREPNEIGIQSVRGGNIVGEHEVLFCGTDEMISLKHTANSRAIFAKGALAAARFLAGKPAGMYGMSDVIRG